MLSPLAQLQVLPLVDGLLPVLSPISLVILGLLQSHLSLRDYNPPAGLQISFGRFCPAINPSLLLLLLVPNIPRTVIDGRVYRQVNSHTVQYDLSRHETSLPLSSLMDGGANGGMTGSDARIISSSDFHRAHVTGIGESTIADLPLVTAAGFVHTHRGPAIVFMHQYAGYG